MSELEKLLAEIYVEMSTGKAKEQKEAQKAEEAAEEADALACKMAAIDSVGERYDAGQVFTQKDEYSDDVDVGTPQ